MNTRKFKTPSIFWLFAAVFILTALFRLYWLGQKQSLGLDESLSVAFATCNHIGTSEKIPSGRFISGHQWREMTWAIKNSLSQDLKTIWLDHRDGCLPNLYYSLLRISLSGLKQISVQDIISRSGILNFSLFVLSFSTFALLLHRLVPGQNLLNAGILLIAYLSPGTISFTLYVRSYQLQQLAFVVTALLFVRTWDWLQDKEEKRIVPLTDVFYPAAVLAFAMLSGYYSLVFIGLLAIPLAILVCRQHQLQKMLLLLSAFLFSIVLSVLIQPKFFAGFFTPPAKCAYLSPTFFSPAYLWDRLCLFYRFFSSNVMSTWALSVLAAAALILWVCKRHPHSPNSISKSLSEKGFWQENKLLFTISAISLLWSIILVYASLFDTPRYFSPCIPLLFLAPAALLRAFRWRAQAFILFLLFILIVWQSSDASNIRYLHLDTGKEVAPFTSEPHIPVVFHIPTASFCNYFSAFLSENQYYVLANNGKELQDVLRHLNLCYLQVYLRHDIDRRDFAKMINESLAGWQIVRSREAPGSDEAFPHASFALLKLARKKIFE